MLFTRKQMLEFLQENIDSGVQDQIFLDYYFYLREIDQKYNSYKTLPLSKWKGEAWEGILMICDSETDEIIGTYNVYQGRGQLVIVTTQNLTFSI